MGNRRYAILLLVTIALQLSYWEYDRNTIGLNLHDINLYICQPISESQVRGTYN